MKKYKVGEPIFSLDNLVCQKGVYQYIAGGNNEHWKYMSIGWVLSYQLKYICRQMEEGHFAFAIEVGEKE